MAIANTGSFSQAALKCHSGTAFLEQAVQRLEAEVGEKLLARSKRRTLLTPAGEITFPRAVRILREGEEMNRVLARSRASLHTLVKIGSLPTSTPYLLADVVRCLTKARPDFGILVHEDTSVNLLRMIDICELDLAIMALPIADRRFHRETLFTEEPLVAVPSKHSLAVKERVGLSDLEKERFIVMNGDHCLGDQIITYFTKNGLRLQILSRSSQIETIQSFVSPGLGMSFVPEMVKLNRRSSLVYRSLENLKPTRVIIVVSRKGREHTRTTVEFRKLLRLAVRAFRETLAHSSDAPR